MKTCLNCSLWPLELNKSHDYVCGFVAKNTRVKGKYSSEIIKCRIEITPHQHCRLATGDACREVFSPTKSIFFCSHLVAYITLDSFLSELMND